MLFPKGHPLPSDKILALHRSNTFHMEAFYADPNELPPGVSPKISCYMVWFRFKTSSINFTSQELDIHCFQWVLNTPYQYSWQSGQPFSLISLSFLFLFHQVHPHFHFREFWFLINILIHWLFITRVDESSNFVDWPFPIPYRKCKG